MIKYRVYDTERNIYLSGENFNINGCGYLTVYGTAKYGGDITQISHSHSSRFIIEQDTGLKDKNGEAIWKGDTLVRKTEVVKDGYVFDTYTVEFSNGKFYGVPVDMSNELNREDFEDCEIKKRVNKMKIIDFEKKGNVVRFYLGDDGCKNYYGDDWDDKPYEHNAGIVYEKYVTGHRDVAFPFEYAVVEPCDGVMNSKWSKDDMKERKVPCIVAVPNANRCYEEYFNEMSHSPQAIRFYFGDEMTPSDKIEVYKEKK